MTEKRYESDLTRKEKRQIEWQKIKSMSWKDRCSHIWAYYKPHMAALLAIILVLTVAGQMIYRAQFETVLSAVILNGGMGDSEAMAQDFKDYLGDQDKYHEISLDSSMYFFGEQTDYMNLMKLSTLVGANEVDVLLAPKEEFEKYCGMDAFISMKDLLTEEQMEAYGEDVSEYGLHVGGKKTLEKYGMTVGDDSYLGVFAFVQDTENAKSFIKYIYEGGES